MQRSRDAGRTWQEIGLTGIDLRALTVDFTRKRAYVPSANLATRQGLFALEY